MKKLDTADWTTHCFGRHLVDLPPNARIDQPIFKMFKEQIKLTKIRSAAELEDVVAAREAELKSQKHDTAGSMFIGRELGEKRAITLKLWSTSNSKDIVRIETFFISNNPFHCYSYNSLGELERLKIGLSIRNDISAALTSRDPRTIPTTLGFCIEQGFIAINELNTESFDVSIGLPGRKDVSFGISTYVQGKVDESLLERTSGLMGSVIGIATGTSTLRRGKHPVGPIDAEEILVAGTEHGKRLYAFEWEAPGKARSIAEPHMSASLGVLEGQYKTNAESFKDDDEALALWDAVIDSIRLRPGAV